MGLIAEKSLWTYEEFCDVVGNDQKADIIDGIIYRASPDNTRSHCHLRSRAFRRRSGTALR